jgi:hypothetical protein
LPSRALLGRLGCPACILEESGVERVADAPLESPEGLLGGFALGDVAVVEGAALAVAVAHLGHRGHVNGVVQLTVPAPGEAVDLAVPGGHLDVQPRP